MLISRHTLRERERLKIGTSWWFGLLGGALLFACGDDGGGTVGGGQMYTTHSSVSDGNTPFGSVLAGAGPGVYGVVPGTSLNTIQDGWSIEYTKFLVSLGGVTFVGTRDGDIDLSANVVIDVQNLSEVGDLVGQVAVTSPPSSIEFSLQPADAATFQALSPSTAEADLELMTAGGYTVYIEGAIEKKDGRSCSPGVPKVCVPASRITFRWGLSHSVRYLGCGTGADLSGPVSLIFPAVRWLYTRFYTDSAGPPPMRAQWIADADLDHDGETTLDELMKAPAAGLFTLDQGYDLTGASTSIATAYDFLREQVRALGSSSWGDCAAIRDL